MKAFTRSSESRKGQALKESPAADRAEIPLGWKLSAAACTVVVAFMAVGTVIASFRQSSGSHIPDFAAFYAASQRLLVGVNPVEVWTATAPYVIEQQGPQDISVSAASWFYPPTFLLLVAPLALFGYLPAFLGWVTATLTGWVVVLRSTIGRKGAGWMIAGFPAAGACAIGGQNAFLTAALAGGAALLWGKGRTVGAGVLVGLLVIKPHLAVGFALGLLVLRAWKAIGAAAITALCVAVASVVAFGSQTIPAWLQSMQIATAKVESGVLPWKMMPTVFASLRMLGTPIWAAYLGHASVAAAAIGVSWIIWRRTGDWRLQMSVAMILPFLVLPYVYIYDLVWLSFPIAWLALVGARDGWLAWERTVLACSWLLPAIAPFITVVQPVPVVTCGLLWLVWRRAETQRLNIPVAEPVSGPPVALPHLPGTGSLP